MKLIKLLLIALLSLGSFIACGNDETTPPIQPNSITIELPDLYKDVPTELKVNTVYENPSLNKLLTTEPIWVFTPIDPSVKEDFTLVGNVLTAHKINAKATLTASYIERMDNQSVTTLNAAITSISITPSSFTIIARKTDKQFKATATFTTDTGDQLVDVTSVADWSIPTTTMTVDNIANKGLVSATSQTDETDISVLFQGQSNIAKVKALETNSNIVDVKITPIDFTLDNGLTKQLTATANYSPVGSIDVTDIATWTSSDTAVTTVENITNKGLVTAKADSGTAEISVVYGITNDKITVTANPAPIFNSFEITGTGGNTVKVDATNQLQTTETIEDSSTSIKDIDSSDYVCTVAEGVTAITITGNCLIKGITEIGSVDITITNEKALDKSKIIQFAVTPVLQ